MRWVRRKRGPARTEVRQKDGERFENGVKDTENGEGGKERERERVRNTGARAE